MFKAIARVRQLWLERRIQRVRQHMQCERTTHLHQMAQLRAELDVLEARRAQATASGLQPMRTPGVKP